jgi:hypothetical protein
MSASRRIPSDEEFERASKQMEERFRGLDNVRDSVKERFRAAGVYDVFVLNQLDVDFRAYVFFETNAALQAAETAGDVARIKAAVEEELAREGRGEIGSLRLAFEFDSDENVQANFEGDYSLRLR